MSYNKTTGVHHYKIHRRHPNRSVAGDVVINFFLVLLAVVFVFPLVFIICQSLKPLSELLKFPPTVFPRNPTFDNYSDLFVILSQSVQVPFTRESWHGRMRACRGVGASMSPEILEKWNKEHSQMLLNEADEKFNILGQICPLYTLLWCAVCVPISLTEKMLRDRGTEFDKSV